MGYRKIQLIILITLLLSIVSVYAYDDSQYQECLEIYDDEDVCQQDFCIGNRDKIACTYPDELHRYFISSLYPMSFDGGLFNYTESESGEVQFKYLLSFDGVANDLQQLLYRDVAGYSSNTQGYYLNYDFINFIKLNQYLYVDAFGVPYIDEPDKEALELMYPNLRNEEIVDLLNLIRKEPMTNNAYTVHNLRVDCDWDGTYDVVSDGNFLSEASSSYDFTEGTRFLTNQAVITWGDVYDEFVEEQCERSIFDIFKRALYGEMLDENKFCNNPPSEAITSFLAGALNEEVVYDRDTFDYDFTFYYSKVPTTSTTFVCNYPQDVYAGQNITVAVTGIAGLSWENIMSGEVDSLDWNNLDDVEFNDFQGSSWLRAFVHRYTFTVDDTGIHGISNEMNWTNQTPEQIIDNERNLGDYDSDEVTTESGIEAELIRLRELAEDNINQGGVSGSGIQIFTRDMNMDKVVLYSLDICKSYLFPFIINISYLFQVIIFISIFSFGINTFSQFSKILAELFRRPKL